MPIRSLINKIIQTIVLLAVLVIIPIATLLAAKPANTATQVELEQQLRDIETQINQLQQQLQSATAEKNTIAAQVKQLKTQQQQISLEIQSTNFIISDLNDKITQTTGAVNQTEAHIALLKSDISRTLLELYQRDSSSFISSLASDNGLAGFFKDVDDFQAINQSLGGALNQEQSLKSDLQTQQQELSDQQQSAEGLLQLRAQQQQDLGGKLAAQSDLLKQSQSKESQVTVVLNYNKQVAAQIRNQIYQLLGITTQVTFGQALDIANTVSASTGVRAAFILAVITQESNLGKNVGTCNRAGDPPSKSWQNIRKPDRDQQPFLEITSELGLDPNTTAISCPAYHKNGTRNGWGGAMGPAQFIPSTWIGYKDKVAQITGKPLANPFDIKDAFYAAGIKLAAGGATSGGTKGEWDSAMRYFSGSTNVRNRFYGDSVMAIAQQYQGNINSLASSSASGSVSGSASN